MYEGKSKVEICSQEARSEVVRNLSYNERSRRTSFARQRQGSTGPKERRTRRAGASRRWRIGGVQIRRLLQCPSRR